MSYQKIVKPSNIPKEVAITIFKDELFKENNLNISKSKETWNGNVGVFKFIRGDVISKIKVTVNDLSIEVESTAVKITCLIGVILYMTWDHD